MEFAEKLGERAAVRLDGRTLKGVPASGFGSGIRQWVPLLFGLSLESHRAGVTPWTILSCVAAYFALLLSVAWWTGRRADASGYFLGNKSSPWWAVALGLIGDSLSGVSYISVPGAVGTGRWRYLQVVFGYVLGYFVIIHVLLPLYYRLNLTSIYGYLGQRFDRLAQRTGAGFFILEIGRAHV